MGLQSELMHSALNVKYSVAGLSFDEIRGFYSAFIRIAARKVDWGCVVRWTPTKFFEFVREMARISINNNIECGRTENDVRNILNRNTIYHEMLCLAKDVYGCGSKELEGGWKTVYPPSELVLNDYRTGLKSRLDRRDNYGGVEYAYALAGTNPMSIVDWENNILQLGGESAQYIQSAKNAVLIANMARAANAKLFFTGHSLGGGLASFCALATKQRAIVFNPAGVSEDTMARLREKPCQRDYDAFIEGFYATNDILNLFQDASQRTEGMRLVFPPAIGRRYYVKSGCLSPIMSHTMSRMVECVNAAQGLSAG